LSAVASQSAGGAKAFDFRSRRVYLSGVHSLLRSAGSDLDSPPQLSPEPPAPIAPVSGGTALSFRAASDLLPDRIESRCSLHCDSDERTAALAPM